LDSTATTGDEHLIVDKGKIRGYGTGLYEILYPFLIYEFSQTSFRYPQISS